MVSVLGGVWFTAIFGKAYAAVPGRNYDPKAKMVPLFYAGPMICMLITVITSAFLMRALAIASLGAAAGFGAVVGFGYLGANAVNMGINPNIPCPIAYGMLSAGSARHDVSRSPSAGPVARTTDRRCAGHLAEASEESARSQVSYKTGGD